MIIKHVPMNLQMFADEPETPPQSGADVLSGILNSVTADPGPTAQPTTTVTEPPVTTTPPADTPPATDPEPEDKSNKAFATLRVQNRELAQSVEQYNQVVTKLAESLGVQVAPGENLLTKLNSLALDGISKNVGIPKEYLERMDRLEQAAKLGEAQALQVEAAKGFETIKTEFGLNNEELVEFAKQLDSLQMNPFQTKVDIRKEFVANNISLITKKAAERAVQEALMKDKNSSQHSTTPNKANGAGGSSPETISTQQGLSAILNGLNI